MKNKAIEIHSETERLVVRPLQEEDYELWMEGWNNRFPSQHKYDDEKIDFDGWTQKKFNKDVVEKLQGLANRDEVYVFGIFRKSDQKHIGKVEICTIMRDEFQWGLLGYSIHNHFWRNGYGKEAVKEILNIAFQELGFHRIEAHINIDNKPSIKLAESVDMQYECTRKAFIFEFEKWNDNLIYYINSK